MVIDADGCARLPAAPGPVVLARSDARHGLPAHRVGLPRRLLDPGGDHDGGAGPVRLAGTPGGRSDGARGRRGDGGTERVRLWSFRPPLALSPRPPRGGLP